MRFEILEHTADVGIRAHGHSLKELFEHAAEGMFSLMADLSKVRPVGEVEVRVRADDREALLVQWLNELLFLHETQHLLLSRFDVAVRGKNLHGRARGERIDRRRHRLKIPVKAVTYHRLTVDPGRGIAEVIFDI